MKGDINLYEVRVTHPEPYYMARGRNRPNGKRTTCCHRLFVASYSHYAAECLARHHCFKKLGKHVDEVAVLKIQNCVEDMGMWAYNSKHLANFKMQGDAQAKQEEEESCPQPTDIAGPAPPVST